jgi:hypothetical protein
MAGTGKAKDGDGEQADLLARLDAAFAGQRGLGPAVLSSVRAWQGTDRTYEVVQGAIRAAPDAPSDALKATTIRAHLDHAIASACVPFDLTTYRGLRDIRRGLDVDGLDDVVGRQLRFAGYSATTVSRTVAVNEFTSRRGLLLELEVPAGTPALWVAGIGHASLRRQGELLLPDGLRLHVYSLGYGGSVPVLKGKVLIG